MQRAIYFVFISIPDVVILIVLNNNTFVRNAFCVFASILRSTIKVNNDPTKQKDVK